MAKNEFEELDVDEMAPEAKVSEVVISGDSKMIASGSAGIVYDWTHAPEGVKAPPRIDLSGKTVHIKKADVILPPMDRPWELTKAGDKSFKYVTFTLFYDTEGQQENYSGMRVFKREENGEVKYSHPTITRDRKNQSSRLLGLYADFKKKDINEVSLREFLGFLNSQPKAKIIKMPVANPQTGEIIEKNMVNEFVQ
jgi:hypothetical protein